MNGKGGAGVRMTGQGWVGDVESGLEFGAEGARPEGRDAKSSESEVVDGGGGDGDFAVLAIKAG